MEQALRIRSEDGPDHRAEPPRPIADAMADGIDKVLRFAAPARASELPFIPPDHGPAGTAQPAAGAVPPVTAREIAAAIDGVREVRQALAAAHERTREAEARTQTLAQRAAEELRAAEGRVQGLEARLRGAEARAAEAEKRAGEADAWLRQIFSTIAQELPARR